MSKKKQGLILFGSPRNNGYTKKVLDMVIQNYKDEYCFEYINSHGQDIKPCIACGYCQISGVCCFNDFQPIDTCIQNADLIIVATPVYNLSVPAPLKAILDRMQVYFESKFKLGIKNPIKKRKSGILVVTSGSKNYEGINIIRKQIKMQFTLINTEFIGEAILTNTDNFPSVDNVEYKGIRPN